MADVAVIPGGGVLVESGSSEAHVVPVAGVYVEVAAAGGGGRIMSSLANNGGLAGAGGIAGQGGGLAG